MTCRAGCVAAASAMPASIEIVELVELELVGATTAADIAGGAGAAFVDVGATLAGLLVSLFRM